MTGSTDQNTSKHPGVELPAALADYADRLLLGTDLDAAHAGLIASGRLDLPAELRICPITLLHSGKLCRR